MFCSTFSTSQITNSSKSEGNRSLLYRTFADFFPQTRVFLYVSLMSPEGSAMGGGGGAQRPVLRVTEPNKTGTRSARAHTRGQKWLV